MYGKRPLLMSDVVAEPINVSRISKKKQERLLIDKLILFQYETWFGHIAFNNDVTEMVGTGVFDMSFKSKLKRSKNFGLSEKVN